MKKSISKFLVLILIIMCLFLGINVYAYDTNDNNPYPIDTPDSETVTIYTDNGSPIEAKSYLSDMSDEKKQQFRNMYQYKTIISDASWFYNCFAFAFYYKGDVNRIPSSPSTAVWLSAENVDKYIEDQSYLEINYLDIREGSIVMYCNNNAISHSGVITTNSGVINLFNQSFINVNSKMGLEPLIQHTLFDLDEYYDENTTIKYYSNYFHIISSKTSINRYFHRGYCVHCESYIEERHVLIQGFSNYMCKYCDYTTPFVPIIQGNNTYYLFANDQSNTLRTYNELRLYLLRNNYLSYLNDLQVIVEEKVK